MREANSSSLAVNNCLQSSGSETLEKILSSILLYNSGLIYAYVSRKDYAIADLPLSWLFYNIASSSSERFSEL